MAGFFLQDIKNDKRSMTSYPDIMWEGYRVVRAREKCLSLNYAFII